MCRCFTSNADPVLLPHHHARPQAIPLQLQRHQERFNNAHHLLRLLLVCKHTRLHTGEGQQSGA